VVSPLRPRWYGRNRVSPAAGDVDRDDIAVLAVRGDRFYFVGAHSWLGVRVRDRPDDADTVGEYALEVTGLGEVGYYLVSDRPPGLGDDR
jgi:hypothetical protein